MASEVFTTPRFRMSFPELFRPKAGQAGGVPKFSVVCIFDLAEIEADPRQKQAWQAIKNAIHEIIKTNYPNGVPHGFKMGLRNGSEKTLEGYGAGKVFFTARTQHRPMVVTAEDPSIFIVDESKIYPGCYGRASVSIYAYSHKAGNKGIAFGLNNVQKLGDGDPLTSRSNPSDDFEAVDNDVKSALLD